MPAVTMRLEMTKQDMRKGRKTGWPVSELSMDEEGHIGWWRPTRVEGSVDYFFCPPYLWRHGGSVSLLV